MNNYKMILTQIENNYKKAGKELGLDGIVDNIKPKYVIKEKSKCRDRAYPLLQTISMCKKYLDNYSKSLDDRFYSYFHVFHELTHLLREKESGYYLKKLYSIVSSLVSAGSFGLLSYLLPSLFPYLLPMAIPPMIIFSYELYELFYASKTKYGPVEEIVTEALTALFISKVFGKEKTEKAVIEASKLKLGKDISEYLEDKHKGNLHLGIYIDSKNMIDKIYKTMKYLLYLLYKKKKLAYDIGYFLGYILLNIDEDKQKEYAKRLLKIHTKEDLKKLIYDLNKDLPNNIKILGYYNIIKKFIDGKVKMEFIYRQKIH